MYPTEKRISNKIQQHFERKIVIESKHSKTNAAISTSETKFISISEETEVKLTYPNLGIRDTRVFSSQF